MVMSNPGATVGRLYGIYARALNDFQPVFLLLIRLYWGWQFFVAGRGKLMNLERTAEFFGGLGIPAPQLNAMMAGGTECFGGLLLMVGVAARIITLPLIGTMIVAYLTAHTDEARALFSHPDDFVTAPPFLFLLASVIVLVFGPGLFSVDGLMKWDLGRGPEGLDAGAKPAPTPGADAVGSHPAGSNRRAFAYLAVVAFGGLLAGALVRRNPPPEDPAPEKEPDSGPEEAAPAPEAKAETQALAQAKEVHVCRGLNTCKGKGKDGNNACAGQGGCATAAKHGCDGLNDCKGQGGCGDLPGQNQCKGQGHCAVPLKKDTWAKARKKFEAEMDKGGKSVGEAPAKG